MPRSRRTFILFAGLILCLGLWGAYRQDAAASNKKEYLDSLSVGISQIIDPTTGMAGERAVQELTEMSESRDTQADEGLRRQNLRAQGRLDET